MRNLKVVLPLMALLVVLAVLVVPAFMSPGGLRGYAWREFHRGVDPSGRYEIVLERRYAFPVTDIVDPRIVARFQLIDRRGEGVLRSIVVVLEEDSDLSIPRIQWEGNRCLINGYDDSEGGSISMELNAGLTVP